MPNIKPHSKVRAAMELAGYNYERMEKALGIAHSTWVKKINGKVEFTLKECNLIATILSKTLDEIFFDDNVSERGQNQKGA